MVHTHTTPPTHSVYQSVVPLTLLSGGLISPIHGNGSHRRSFMYVSDVTAAFDTILHSGVIGETYNIGTDFELSTEGVLRSIIKLMKKPLPLPPLSPPTASPVTPAKTLSGKLSTSKTTDDLSSSVSSSASSSAATVVVPSSDLDVWAEYVEDRPFNDQRYRVDNSKLRGLGWRPRVQWEEGLQLTIEWYLKHRSHWGNIGHALVPHPRLPSSALMPLPVASAAAIHIDCRCHRCTTIPNNEVAHSIPIRSMNSNYSTGDGHSHHTSISSALNVITSKPSNTVIAITAMTGAALIGGLIAYFGLSHRSSSATVKSSVVLSSNTLTK